MHKKPETDLKKFDFTQIRFVGCRRGTQPAQRLQHPERAAYAGAISARAPSTSTRRSAFVGGGWKTIRRPLTAASSPRTTGRVPPPPPGAPARSSKLIATCVGAPSPTSTCRSTRPRACESGGRRTINSPQSNANPSHAHHTII